MTHVINIVDAPRGWKNDPRYVYIARPSIFGNPYHLPKESARGSTLRKYETYLKDKITKDVEFAKAVKDLHGKILVCFCAPLPCHGEILARYAAYLNKET